MSSDRGLFLACLALFLVLTHGTAESWNDASRLAQVQALVENRTFVIDQSTFAWTGDKYMYGGHFYSDKPPLLALAGTMIYGLLFLLSIGMDQHPALAYVAISAFTIALPCAAAVPAFRAMLRVFTGCTPVWATLVAWCLACASLYLPYATLISNHAVSGAFLTLGTWCLVRPRRGPHEAAGLRWIALGGFLMSLAGGVDITCFAILPMVALALLGTSFLAACTFGIGALPVTLAYFWLNWLTSGSLLPPAMNTSLWVYPGSAFSEATLSGVAGYRTAETLSAYAYHMLMGGRGLLSHTPILLMALPALAAPLWGATSRRCSFIYAALAIYCVVFLGLYLFRSTDLSGAAFGVRWFATIMPFLLIPLGSMEAAVRGSLALRVTFVVLALASLASAFLGAFAPFPHFVEKATNTVLLNAASLLRALQAGLSDLTHGRWLDAVNASFISAVVVCGAALVSASILAALMRESFAPSQPPVGAAPL